MRKINNLHTTRANKWIYCDSRCIAQYGKRYLYTLHLICVEIVIDCHSLCGYACVRKNIWNNKEKKHSYKWRTNIKH